MEKAYSQIAISHDAEEHMKKDPEILQLQNERLASELGLYLLKEGYISISKHRHFTEHDSYIARAYVIPASEEEYREHKRMKMFLDTHANIKNQYEIWKVSIEMERRHRNEHYGH